jgi:hypothetical protein
MDRIEIEKKFRETYTIKSELHFNRYLNYFEKYFYSFEKYRVNCIMEKHHIFPVSLFPEYKKEKWNKVKISAREHFLLHFLLYKAIKSSSMVYAFNQMRRYLKTSSCQYAWLYVKHREEICKIISKCNTGRIRTEEQKLAMSISRKGMMAWKNLETGETCYALHGSLKYPWVHICTGNKHSENTKKQIGESQKGKLWQYNPATGEIRQEYELLDGFVWGMSPELKKHNSLHIQKRIVDSLWVIKDGKELRVKSGDITDDMTVGRLPDTAEVGLSIMNNKDYKKLLNLKTKQYELVLMKTSKPWQIPAGAKLSTLYIFEYKGIYSASANQMWKCFSYLPIKNGKKDLSLMNKLIPKPRPNWSKERNEFYTKYHGETLHEVGFHVIPLKDYTFSEEHIWLK